MNNQLDKIQIQNLKLKADSLTDNFDQNEKDNKADLIELVSELNSKTKNL